MMIIIHLYLFSAILSNLNNGFELISNVLDIESLYVNEFLNLSNKLSTVCDLPREIKLSLCFLYFSLHIRNDFQKEIFFNNTASQQLEPNCSEKEISFLYYSTLNNNESRRKLDMFPCFGRHNPMRTNWHVDDNFDYIYISGFPSKNTIFIHKNAKNIYSDSFLFNGVLALFNVETLIPLKIYDEDIISELKMLDQTYVTINKIEIETIYIREVLQLRYGSLRNNICTASPEIKLLLCQRIFTWVNLSWTVQRKHYTDSNVICQKKEITLKNIDYNGNVIFEQEMFPCHAINLNNWQTNQLILEEVWYLSEGSREDSFILYEKENKNIVSLFAFIENINTEEI